MNRTLPACLIALHVATCPCSFAQTPAAPEPVALTTTRSSFLRQVMLDSQLLTEQYERALGKAEIEVALAGDYEEARAIRERREELRALYAGTASSLATPLPLSQARMMGSAQPSGETLSGWRSNGSGAEWQNFRLVPGSYHLEFEVNMSDAPIAGSIYASSKFQPQKTATFEFNEVTLLGDSAENRRTFDIEHSPDETTFATIRVGPLNFTRSPITLRFANTSGYPANIIRIRNLRLMPVTEKNEAAAVSNPPDSTASLQQAALELKNALEESRKAASSSYLASLDAIASKEPALKNQIEAEKRRIEQGSPRSKGPSGLRAITAGAGSLNGFEDLDEALLSNEEPEAGDRFKIVHEGRTLSIRLLWVSCVPPDSHSKRVKDFASYFKIEDEDAIAVGRAAREFTAGYLRDKPLRLLLRPDRDKDGTAAALVFVPGVGLYQNILIDHGMAALALPPQDARRNATEKALIASLTARENAARRRNPPPGGWALGSDTSIDKKP